MAARREAAVAVVFVEVPCPECWGQRRILEPARNGEGLIPVACGRCLGTGIR